MDPTAARRRIADATKRTLIAMNASVDPELLRYGGEVQAADAMALLAERVVNLQARLEALEAKPKRKRTAADE